MGENDTAGHECLNDDFKSCRFSSVAREEYQP
jgi:hypothetical protein